MKYLINLSLVLFVLIQFSSCKDIRQSKSENLFGQWKVDANFSKDNRQQIISGSEASINESIAIILLQDSTFQMINNGNIFPKHTAISLGFGDTILGLWRTIPDSLFLRIPYKSDTLTGSYKIIDKSNSGLTLEQKEFEVETYRILKLSKY